MTRCCLTEAELAELDFRVDQPASMLRLLLGGSIGGKDVEPLVDVCVERCDCEHGGLRLSARDRQWLAYWPLSTDQDWCAVREESAADARLRKAVAA